MSYTQTSFLSALQGMAAIQPGDTDFAAIVNSAIDYAEQRIYRELDLLAATVRDRSLKLTPNVRELVFNQNTPFVTVQELNVMTKLFPGDLASMKRTPLSPVSRDVIEAVYGSPVPVATPKWFCMLDNQTVMVGPWPDQAYPVEIVGAIHPPALYSLSNANTGTWLSTNLPDLFMAATMIFVSGYQKNFGSQADTAPAAVSWESQYETLKDSALKEEARRKFQASGWTSLSPPDDATPSR